MSNLDGGVMQRSVGEPRGAFAHVLWMGRSEGCLSLAPRLVHHYMSRTHL